MSKNNKPLVPRNTKEKWLFEIQDMGFSFKAYLDGWYIGRVNVADYFYDFYQCVLIELGDSKPTNLPFEVSDTDGPLPLEIGSTLWLVYANLRIPSPLELLAVQLQDGQSGIE